MSDQMNVTPNRKLPRGGSVGKPPPMETLEKGPKQTEEGFPKVQPEVMSKTLGGKVTFARDAGDPCCNKRSRLEGLTDERDILAAIRYHPRGDMCLLREVKRGTLGNLAIPDRSDEGKDYRVIAVGPDVTDIKPGMNVFIIGRQGFEWGWLPSVEPECGHGLFMLRAVNIPLIEVKPK